MPPIQALLRQASRRLSGSNSARLDSEILLSKVLQVDRTALYAYPEATPTEAQYHAFDALVKQRMQGYPIGYLTGHKEFWSLDFMVNTHTLIPRPETELMVEKALSLLRHRPSARILELGTGSGAIAIALGKEMPTASIWASEIDSQALNTARKNARRHGVNPIHFLQGSWFEPIQDAKFDMLISNPPYIARHAIQLQQDGVRFEPRTALIGGHDGLESLDHIIAHGMHYLLPGGFIILEHGYDQAAAVTRQLQQHQYHSPRTLQDHAGLDRLSYASWPTG